MNYPRVPPDFPPAPWRVWGRMELGLFPAARQVTLRDGLTALASRHLLVGTIRYLGGDLRYNLFMIASMARRRHRAGIYLHHIWVDSPSSQQASAALWGLPTRLADFSWAGEAVRITNDSGLSIAFALRPRTRVVVPIWLRLPCFGTHDGQLVYSNVPIRARARPATMNIRTWSEQLPGLRRYSTTLVVDMPQFRMTVPDAQPIADL
jgi:hypothetical protein